MRGKPEAKTELLEKLAELEHEQWMEWSKSVQNDIDIIRGKGYDRLVRWRTQCWKPYSELTEEQKEQDRVWARKVLGVSEDEHKREMDEFGRQNEALAIVCADLKEKNGRLEGENKKLQDEKEGLEHRLDMLTRRYNHKRRKIEALEGRLEAIRTALLGFKVWLNGKEWRGVSPELVDDFEERLGVLLKEGDKK